MSPKEAEDKILELAKNGCTSKQIFDGATTKQKPVLFNELRKLSTLGKLEKRNEKWFTK